MIATSTLSQQATDIHRVFALQKNHQFAVANSTARERIAKLDKLHQALLRYKEEIRQAMYQDFHKPAAEVDLTEIYAVTSEIKHTRRHLRRWMKPKRVGTPLAFLGPTSRIVYEPKGVCLIISPWNFPINLTFGPLVSAIAAGNTVIIKPSEHTPHSAAIMKKIIDEIFEEREIALFEGAVETATTLLELPFNHIFFTGAPAIGKVVMAAAAKNLSSVTLELGGKSPTIIDETADLKAAAKRIAYGKFINNGQICIAPDYIYVHESKAEELVQRIGANIKAFYGASIQESSDYSRMVNNRHFERVNHYLEDAKEKGATIAYGGYTDATQDLIEPTLVTNVPSDSLLMEEEIFGPILPVLTYRNIQEVVDGINAKEKPLALYIYSRRKKNVEFIMRNTRAGGTCINSNDLHFYNNNLPFGGSNNSGIGKSKGHFGFEEFSNARAVYQQIIPGALEFLTPPYNKGKQTVIDQTIKWL